MQAVRQVVDWPTCEATVQAALAVSPRTRTSTGFHSPRATFGLSPARMLETSGSRPALHFGDAANCRRYRPANRRACPWVGSSSWPRTPPAWFQVGWQAKERPASLPGSHQSRRLRNIASYCMPLVHAVVCAILTKLPPRTGLAEAWIAVVGCLCAAGLLPLRTERTANHSCPQCLPYFGEAGGRVGPCHSRPGARFFHVRAAAGPSETHPFSFHKEPSYATGHQL